MSQRQRVDPGQELESEAGPERLGGDPRRPWHQGVKRGAAPGGEGGPDPLGGAGRPTPTPRPRRGRLASRLSLQIPPGSSVPAVTCALAEGGPRAPAGRRDLAAAREPAGGWGEGRGPAPRGESGHVMLAAGPGGQAGSAAAPGGGGGRAARAARDRPPSGRACHGEAGGRAGRPALEHGRLPAGPHRQPLPPAHARLPRARYRGCRGGRRGPRGRGLPSRCRGAGGATLPAASPGARAAPGAPSRGLGGP